MTTTPAPRPQRGESGSPALPEGRYGTARGPRKPRSRRGWVVGVAGVVVGGVVAFVASQNLGTAPIEAQRRAFAEQPGDAMEITLDITREDASRPGVCIVRVRDLSGAESGRREVLIPPSESTVKTVIKSIGKPVTADVFGCSYDVPDYLSTTVRPTG